MIALPNPSKIIVIIGAHRPYQGALCEASLMRMGLPYAKFCDGYAWPGDFRRGKTVPQLACVLSLPAACSHVLFTDSADTMAMCGEDEILAKFDAMQVDGVLISGEKNCFPDENLRSAYPPSSSPYRYLNSGGWMGTRRAVADALKWCVASEIVDDQRAWTAGFLSGAIPVTIDTGCLIFQTTNRQWGEFDLVGPRVWNRKTGTAPCIVHWPGPWHSDPHMEFIRPFTPGMVTQMDAATAGRYVDKFPVGLGAV